MTSPEHILSDALEAHRRGAMADAKRLYARALELNPRNAMACSNLAIIVAQDGNLAKAEGLFRQALAVTPHYPEGFNNLGSLLQQQGRLDEAISAHRRAIALRADYPAAYCCLGNALKRQGKAHEAQAAYRQAIELKPDYIEASNNLGVVLQQQGNLDEALQIFRRVIELRPNDPEAYYNLGVVLQELSRLEEAHAAYEHAVRLGPSSPEIYVNLGSVRQELGRIDEAMTAFDLAIRLNPAYAEAHYNRGIALHQKGRWDDAIAAYRHAIGLRPEYAEALDNLSIVLQEQGRPDEAIAASEQAVKLRPTHAETHNNSGIALLAQGRLDEALRAFQQALALKHDYPEAFYNLGNTWRELGKPEGAIAAYRQALRLRPDDDDAFSQLVHQLSRACDWGSYEPDQQKLLDLVRRGAARIPPFFLFATQASAADQLACSRLWSDPIARSAPRVFQHGRSTEHRRIRVGYLSADFHQHATAYLTAELFECHDRSRFEVLAYSHDPGDASPMRERLTRAFDRFSDIRQLSHAQAAQHIHADGVDILIDLKGHTLHARTAILASRPAPVQVNYLGFPGTMGADFMDYIMLDSFVVPADQQPLFAEKLVHLPGCYQPNDSTRGLAPVPSREQCGLPPKALVFCSFNNSYKITPAFFDIWVRLLKKVPGSVLWLLEANPLAKRNLLREAASRGVELDRLVFAPIKPIAHHLARHRHADIFLDTLPCNAHTTASDALWAGLPVLTCAGHTFAGRVAGSLLNALGMPELITTSLESYEALALDLARQPERLNALRDKLEKSRKASALFDTARFTRNVEAAYTRMWEIWRAGEAPAAFAVERLQNPAADRITPDR